MLTTARHVVQMLNRLLDLQQFIHGKVIIKPFCMLTFFSVLTLLVIVPTLCGLFLPGTIQIILQAHKTSGFLYF